MGTAVKMVWMQRYSATFSSFWACNHCIQTVTNGVSIYDRSCCDHSTWNCMSFSFLLIFLFSYGTYTLSLFPSLFPCFWKLNIKHNLRQLSFRVDRNERYFGVVTKNRILFKNLQNMQSLYIVIVLTLKFFYTRTGEMESQQIIDRLMQKRKKKTSKKYSL